MNEGEIIEHVYVQAKCSHTFKDKFFDTFFLDHYYYFRHPLLFVLVVTLTADLYLKIKVEAVNDSDV